MAWVLPRAVPESSRVDFFAWVLRPFRPAAFCGILTFSGYQLVSTQTITAILRSPKMDQN